MQNQKKVHSTSIPPGQKNRCGGETTAKKMRGPHPLQCALLFFFFRCRLPQFFLLFLSLLLLAIPDLILREGLFFCMKARNFVVRLASRADKGRNLQHWSQYVSTMANLAKRTSRASWWKRVLSQPTLTFPAEYVSSSSRRENVACAPRAPGGR